MSSNSNFKPFAISSSAMQRVKSYTLYQCGSYFFTLSLNRLSLSAICSLLLLETDECCNEEVTCFVSSLTSVNVQACSTNMVAGFSSRFLFKILLLVSSPCLDLVLKKIANWLHQVYRVDII